MVLVTLAWTIGTGGLGYIMVNDRKPLAMAFFAMIELLKWDPIFQTEYPQLDAALAFILHAALLSASYFVLARLGDSWLAATKAERTPRQQTLRVIPLATMPKSPLASHQTLYYLPNLTITFVTILRFSNRSIKLSSFKVQQGIRDTRKLFKETSDYSDFLPGGADVKLKAYKCVWQTPGLVGEEGSMASA